jgi:hypothetical protein
MSLLAPDFEAKGQIKLRRLLEEKKTAPTPPSSQKAVPEEVCAVDQQDFAEAVPESDLPEMQVAANTTDAKDVICDVSEVVVNEKLVKLTDLGGRKTVLKDCPSHLDLVASEDDIPKFSLEALKKLAKAASLELPKQVNKPTVIALLVDAYRNRKSGGSEMREEEGAACSLR